MKINLKNYLALSRPLAMSPKVCNCVTLQACRYTYLLNQLVLHKRCALFVGPTGTGKSVYIKKHLQNGLPDNFTSTVMTFSAQTSANMTQDIVDGRLDKRKRGVFGPPVGKQLVVFVDDLNMPLVEVYGAQPPIELLRQGIDHGGWCVLFGDF